MIYSSRYASRNNKIHRNRGTNHTNQNNNNNNNNSRNENSKNREGIIDDTNNIFHNNDNDNSVANESMPGLQERQEDSDDEDRVFTNVSSTIRADNREGMESINNLEEHRQIEALRIRGGGHSTSSSSSVSSNTLDSNSDSFWDSDSNSDKSIQISTRIGNVVIEDVDDTFPRK